MDGERTDLLLGKTSCVERLRLGCGQKQYADDGVTMGQFEYRVGFANGNVLWLMLLLRY